MDDEEMTEAEARKAGSGSPWARVAIVLVAYGVGVLVLWPALGALQRLLILPELFLRYASVGLAVGVGLAVAVAWRYPDIGNGGGSS